MLWSGGGEKDQEEPHVQGSNELVALLFLAGSPPARAQDASQLMLSQTDMNILTDARIGILKAVLQLTPEQAKLWPAVEEAIRARAQTRYQRIAAVAERLNQAREVNPVELLRGRAEALAKRSVGLNKLLDAWEPLYQSLNPDQNQRMRALAMRVILELRDAVDGRRMEAYDEVGP